MPRRLWRSSVRVVALLDVRRLAAADMWGSAGTIRRRRLIRAEFVVGAAGCTILGVLGLLSSGVWVLAGVWLVGVGANYVPLAMQAHSLSSPGALEAELKNVDIARELRRAGVKQLWIAVPFVVAIVAVTQCRAAS